MMHVQQAAPKLFRLRDVKHIENLNIAREGQTNSDRVENSLNGKTTDELGASFLDSVLSEMCLDESHTCWPTW